MNNKEIYVDGCCNKKIGACSSVVNSDYEDCIEKYYDFLKKFDFFNDFEYKILPKRHVLKVEFNDVEVQQNNGAELLSFVIGCCIAYFFDYSKIYSDSQLVVQSWSKKISDTIKCEKKRKLQSLCVFIAEKYREKGGIIEWVPSGKNLADLKNL